MKSLEDPSIYHSAEFFKNGKSILKMRTSATIKKHPLNLEQGRRLTEYVRISQETSISSVLIDSIGPTGSWALTELSENYLMFKNYPFEGINCFKREN